MFEKFIYWVRWILILPGAVVSSFLATFPLHWILYFLFDGRKTDLGSAKSFVQLSQFFFKNMNLQTTEHFLSPIVVAATFIIVGYSIAPRHKFKVALILFGMYAGFIISASLLILFLRDSRISFSINMIFAFLSALIALILVKEKSEKDDSNDSFDF